MRKLFMILSICIVLSGCSMNAYFDNSSYDKAIENALSQPLSEYATMNRDLFSYYIPPSIGRKSASLNSVTLQSHNQNILMILDVINILNESYYKDDGGTLRRLLKVENAFYTSSGFYENDIKALSAYLVSAMKLSDNTVLLSLQTENFVYMSIHPLSISPDILYDMFRVARSTTINRDLILSTYSTREVLDFRTQSLNMFTQAGPESGTVLDMIKGEDDITFEEEYYEGFDENAPVDSFEEGIIEE
ncbi:MAG: hypothetical protein ACYDEI_00465 [Erysipelotrichaceae bacterium]